MGNPPQGFLRPTTTPTPDELFDVWLHQLSGSELKVLLYIVRRTFGFKKDADTISISQICNGITTREGKVLDHGTGLARSTVSKAIRRLEALGLILVERSLDEKSENEVNTYRLNFRGGDDETSEGVRKEDRGSSKIEPGVVRKKNHPGSETEPPVVRKANPQQTESQETVGQQTVRQLPPAPPESEDSVDADSKPTGAGGGNDSLKASQNWPQTRDSPPDLPVDTQKAVEHLIGFGVWRSQAEHVVRQYKLTPELVQRACAAIEREVAKGRRIGNAPAVLLSRFRAGWDPPPLPAEKSVDYETVAMRSLPPPEPPRKPLPSIIDVTGVEREAYKWFEAFKEQLQLQLPRDTFKTWLRDSELVDYRPPNEERAGELIIYLDKHTAPEWVNNRLHKAVQRSANFFAGVDLEVRFTTNQPEVAPTDTNRKQLTLFEVQGALTQ
jgi:DNA-binding transcriptional ArsR family regulator